MRDRVHIGNIISTYGNKGFLKILPLVEDPQAFTEAKEMIIFGEPEPFTVETIRFSSPVWLIKFHTIDGIGAANQFVGRGIYRDGYKRQLGEDEYFISELIGLKAVDMQGQILGHIVHIDTSAYQDLLTIETPDHRNIFVPFVHAFVQHIDLQTREMKLSPIQGMFS